MISKVCRCRNQFLLSGHQVVEARVARLLVHHSCPPSTLICAWLHTSYTHGYIPLTRISKYLLLYPVDAPQFGL